MNIALFSNNTETTAPYTRTELADKATIIGWFANKYNFAAGWYLTELTDYDKEWFASEGASTEGVYRTYHTSDLDRSNLVKVNFEKGTYAFVDNDHYLETDKIKFQRMVRYNRALVVA